MEQPHDLVRAGVPGSFLNYGQITNQVRAQDAVFQQAILAYQAQVLEAQSEVEDSLVEFQKAQELSLR